MGSWRALGVRRATAQSALDEGLGLLDGLQRPTAVWWQVERPALVLSRGSRVQADEAACRDAGVDVVRRGSGGGPVVWTDELVALDVAVPRTHELWSADVVASYRWLGELLADTLRAFGVTDAVAVPPEVARSMNDPELAAMACYAGVSPWEVTVGGRKVVGLSQVRRAPGVLLQVGVLGQPEGDIADLLDLTPTERSRVRAELGERTIGLRELGVRPDALVEMVAEALTER
jgi:lipoate-protein ligase A